MKPEKQRIKIAEVCGWKQVCSDAPLLPIGVLYGVREGNLEVQKWERIPDYLNDLNATHEGEKLVFDSYDRSQWFRYITHLQNVCFCAGNATHMDHLHATAAQRAEALLKTLGLWEGALSANALLSDSRHKQNDANV